MYFCTLQYVAQLSTPRNRRAEKLNIPNMRCPAYGVFGIHLPDPSFVLSSQVIIFHQLPHIAPGPPWSYHVWPEMVLSPFWQRSADIRIQQTRAGSSLDKKETAYEWSIVQK